MVVLEKTVPDNDEDLQEQPPDPPEPTETEVENEPEIIENEPEIAEIQPEIIEKEPEIQPETKKRGRPKKEPAPKPEPKKRGRPPKPIVSPSPKTPTVAERSSTTPTIDEDTYNQYLLRALMNHSRTSILRKEEHWKSLVKI